MPPRRQNPSELYEDAWTCRQRRRNLLAGYEPSTETVFLPSDATFGETPTDVDAPQMVIAGHELAHHLQMISTLYGASIRSIDSLRNDLIRKFYIHLYECKSIPPIRVPLVDLVTDLKKAPSVKQRKAIRNFDQSFHILRLKKALEGLRNYEFQQLEDPIQTFSGYLSPGIHNLDRVLAKLILLPPPPDVRALDMEEKTSPVINGKPFGGLHILEALAWMTEVVHAGVRAENPPPTTWTVGGREKLAVSAVYQYAFVHYLQHRLGSVDVSAVFTRPTVYGVEHILGFVAAAHLSLMVPLHPAFQLLMPTGTTWYDIHPGWRFMRMCNVVTDVPRVLPDLSNYEDVQESICSRFNWPGPRTIRQHCKNLLLSLPPREVDDIHALDFLRVCEAIVESERFAWCTTFTPSRYPGIDPGYKRILQTLSDKYGPTIIQSDFGIVPGWRAPADKPFFNMFKDNREFLLRDEMLRLFGVSRPPLQQYHAEYALTNLLVQGWFDYVMSSPKCDPFDFLGQMFPPAQSPSVRNHFLMSLLEVGTMMYSFCQLNHFVDGKTGRSVIDLVVHLPPNVSQQDYELFLDMVKTRMEKPRN
jgi:hypothetical protein